MLTAFLPQIRHYTWSLWLNLSEAWVFQLTMKTTHVQAWLQLFFCNYKEKKKSNAKFYYLLFSWWRRHKNVFHKSNKFQLNNAPNFLQPRTYKATKSLSTEIQTTIWEQLKFKKIGLVMLQHSKNRHQNLHSLIQPLIHVWLFATPWIAACQAYLSITNSQSLLKVVSIESVIPSNHLIPCCPLLLLPSIFPNIRVFSNESVLRIRWPKYWSFSFSISSSNEHSGLISFRMDWLDLLAVQGTLKSLLQHHSTKASILWHPFFFMVQLSYLYMTTGNIIALTSQTFVGFLICCLAWSELFFQGASVF